MRLSFIYFFLKKFSAILIRTVSVSDVYTSYYSLFNCISNFRVFSRWPLDDPPKAAGALLSPP